MAAGDDRSCLSREAMKTLFDFTRPGTVTLWQPVNDGVMGGISESRLVEQYGACAIFTGNVSLESGGGFASVRTVPGSFDLGMGTGIVLEVKGDGKSYKLNLVDDLESGVLFQARFTPPIGQWSAVHVPLSDFLPTFRGRTLHDHRALNALHGVSFGLMISDRQSGSFRLEIRSISIE